VARARQPETEPSARPFIKWVGGKRQLLPALLGHVPKTYGTYHEPFLGGAALFFGLRPERAVLTDSNVRLIRTYLGIRDDVDTVIGLLKSYKYDRGFFEEMRARDIDRRSDAEVAAWFIYLNRTGFNGLYRVNSKNRFNVPFGRYENPTICDEDNLRACSRALATATIDVKGFEAILERADPNDFVYFDPPYVPLSATSSFTSYTSDGFGPEQQTKLRDVALALKARGVRVLLSNSASPVVRELYRGFQLEEVGANRMVNSRGAGRGKIAELLIWSEGGRRCRSDRKRSNPRQGSLSF
jgi:DNA adenine methylase